MIASVRVLFDAQLRSTPRRLILVDWIEYVAVRGATYRTGRQPSELSMTFVAPAGVISHRRRRARARAAPTDGLPLRAQVNRKWRRDDVVDVTRDLAGRVAGKLRNARGSGASRSCRVF